MIKIKEMRVMLDENTHNAFKGACGRNGKSMKQVIMGMVADYIEQNTQPRVAARDFLNQMKGE